MGDSEVQETCHETIPSPHIAGGSVLGVHGLKMKKFSFIWKSPLIPKHLGALYILGKLSKWREKGFRSPCTTVLLLRRPPEIHLFPPVSLLCPLATKSLSCPLNWSPASQTLGSKLLSWASSVISLNVVISCYFCHLMLFSSVRRDILFVLSKNFFLFL